MIKKWHINNQGNAEVCTASIRCPFMPIDEHGSTAQEARERFEESMQSQLLTATRSSLTDKLLAKNDGHFPEEILVQMGGLLESKEFKTMVVIPAGSHLYNSTIPGAAVHDYDFTVFAEPHPSLSHHDKKYLQGELDVNVVPITKLDKATRRSSSLAEAFYAYRSNEQLLSTASESPWQPYLRSMRIPLVRYFDLLDDVKRAHERGYEEPVSRDNKVEFKNFKHSVRWTLYQRRWNDTSLPADSFNPRLSDEERELYLKTLESGRLRTALEG